MRGQLVGEAIRVGILEERQHLQISLHVVYGHRATLESLRAPAAGRFRIIDE